MHVVPKLPSSLVKEKKKYRDSNTLPRPFTDTTNEEGPPKGGNRGRSQVSCFQVKLGLLRRWSADWEAGVLQAFTFSSLNPRSGSAAHFLD